MLICFNGGYTISILQKLEVLNDHKQTVGISNSTLVSSGVSQHRPPTKYDPLSHMSSTFMTNDNIVDASSEKDLVAFICPTFCQLHYTAIPFCGFNLI